MKIVFLDASVMGEMPLEPIEALGGLVCWPTSTREEALQRVGDCEVLIINKIIINDELLDAAPKLRLVCEAATGVNNIDLEACARRGILVRNVAGYSTEPVVQQTFMHILSLIGKGPYFDELVKSGAYSRSPIFTDLSRSFNEIDGMVMGIIGMGTIGQRVATVAKAFGMKVIYYSTSGTSHCKDYPSVPLEELLRESDVVSIHCPLNERTKGLIGAEQLAMMQPSAIIVNMGRGGIVDEKALAEAIDAEEIAGAAADVFSTEPIPADNPLLHTRFPDRLRFTPHLAWASVEARKRLVARIADNIRKGW